MIRLERASLEDAELLTHISKESFDDHSVRWGVWTTIGDSRGAGGYDSVSHFIYLIKVSFFYKIMLDDEVVGGIGVFTSDRVNAVIDFLFIHPQYKGKHIGVEAIRLVEEKFYTVNKWSLGTSPYSGVNHQFYEKVGYKKSGEDEDYWYYEKYVYRNKKEPKEQKKKLHKLRLFWQELMKNGI